MRKVLIGTPCYDGRVDVWYANSLVNTVKMSYDKDVFVHPIYCSYDSLIQRARNSLVQIAMDSGFDDLFFIDSDVEWEPEWFFRILERPEPIVGAALVKKSDKEAYTIKLVNKELNWSSDKKLIEVDGIGTGFMKINRFALEKLWDMSEPYNNEGKSYRMICDIKIQDGDLVSEDYIICQKWQSLGYKTWIDPSITINHVGIKKFTGNIQSFLTQHGYK